MTPTITPTDLIAAATRLLMSSGYVQARTDSPDWNTGSTRLFEDSYGVVGVAVFATCAELLASWATLQGSLVDVISTRVGSSEHKAWDGYLVLLTPGPAPSSGTQIEEICYDTTRLRKLVGTADDLATPGDVERLLRPLLPLRTERDAMPVRSALDMLPAVLSKHGISEATTAALIEAFVERKPLLERLQQDEASR